MRKPLSAEEILNRLENRLKEGFIVNEPIKGLSIESEFSHEKCGHKWNTKPYNVITNGVCPICYKESKKQSQGQFEARVKKVHGTKFTVCGEYKGIDKKVKVKHNECNHVWDVTPNYFLNMGTGCPSCHSNSIKTTEKFKKEVKKLTNGEYKVIGTYINSTTHIEMKHNVCGRSWNITPNAFSSIGNRCPYCARENRRKKGA